MSFLLTQGVLQQQVNRAGGKQYALEFNGESDYVEFGNISQIENKNIEIISSILVPDIDRLSTGEVLLYGGKNGTTDYRFYTRYAGERSRFYSRIDGFSYFNYEPRNKGIIECKLKATSTRWEIYIDDVLYYQDNRTAEMPGNFLFGKSADNTYYFLGNAYALKIIDLDAGDIYLDGDFTKNNPNTLHDKSIYQNHGTIYGANWIEL